MLILEKNKNLRKSFVCSISQEWSLYMFTWNHFFTTMPLTSCLSLFGVILFIFSSFSHTLWNVN